MRKGEICLSIKMQAAAPMDNNENKKEIILSVKDLVVEFALRGEMLTATRHVSLDIYKGESLAIVGESGSGKSVFTKTFIGLLDSNGKITNGSIEYGGMDLASVKSKKEWQSIRGGEIAMIMQDPMTSLNPLKKIGVQIRESILLHTPGITKKEAKERAIKYIEDVGIPDAEERYYQYPHEFSGGMRQRVVIAIALACNPKILICDEPTTALDVTIQAQILDLLHHLKQKYNLTIVFITHDLGVVANIADRVAVMYAGDIVEIGQSKEIYQDARHPYTKALLKSLPQLGTKGEPLFTIKGTPPALSQKIYGDAFALRNPDAMKIDFKVLPPYFKVSETHFARTWLLDPRCPQNNDASEQ